MSRHRPAVVSLALTLICTLLAVVALPGSVDAEESVLEARGIARAAPAAPFPSAATHQRTDQPAADLPISSAHDPVETIRVVSVSADRPGLVRDRLICFALLLGLLLLLASPRNLGAAAAASDAHRHGRGAWPDAPSRAPPDQT